jgi:hypothetical protein
MPPPDPTSQPPEIADPHWFREPTPREHKLAAALFVAFGVFFIALFIVLAGWWFRWVILGLGGISILHGLWHAVEARPEAASGAERNGQTK